MPKPAAPDDAPYAIAQIARAAGIQPRTVRFWIKRGLVPPAVFRGPNTRYTEAHRVRVCVIQKLREEGLLFPDIRQKLAKASHADLEAMLAPQPSAQRATEPSSASPPTPASPRSPLPAPTYPAQRWERIELVPGLEIHVNHAGSPLLQRMAQDIYDWFGPRGAESAGASSSSSPKSTPT